MLQDKLQSSTYDRSWIWLDITEVLSNFAALEAPLSDLMRKGQPNKVEWGKAQEKAYQSIKALLTKEPVLRLPDSGKTNLLYSPFAAQVRNCQVQSVIIQPSRKIV